MRKWHIIILAALFSMGSCKKENSNRPSENQSNRFSSFILLDTSQSSPNDTLTVSNYTYDNNNRLTRINERYLVNANSIRIVDKFLFYMSADSLPFKTLTKTVSNSPDTVFKENHFNYNLQGQTISDSQAIYASNGTDTTIGVWSYAYQPGITTRIFRNPAGLYPPDTVYISTATTTGATFETEQNYSGTNRDIKRVFDDHHTPFTRSLAVKYFPTAYSQLSDMYFNGMYYPSAESNVLDYDYTDHNIPTNAPAGFPPKYQHFIYQYEYNSEDYPVKVRISGSINQVPLKTYVGIYNY